MIGHKQIIVVPFTDAQVRAVEENAKAASLGGMSNIRESDDRKRALWEDQLAGQLGEAAGSIYTYGSIEPYQRVRDIRNANPHAGDDGCDIEGKPIDVKTSNMRGPADPLSYRLCVRPRERKPNWWYMLALVPPGFDDLRYVLLMGFVSTGELPTEPEKEGVLKGAYVLRASQLRPLPLKTHAGVTRFDPMMVTGLKARQRGLEPQNRPRNASPPTER